MSYTNEQLGHELDATTNRRGLTHPLSGRGQIDGLLQLLLSHSISFKFPVILLCTWPNTHHTVKAIGTSSMDIHLPALAHQRHHLTAEYTE